MCVHFQVLTSQQLYNLDLPIPFLPGLESIDFGSSGDIAGYSTPTLPRHTVHMGSTVSDPWRNSTIATKGNGYPPAPSYLASPPITSAESPTAADPEAARKEMYQWFLNVDTIRITFAPEKEGIFLFKHTNYIVESKVIQKEGRGRVHAWSRCGCLLHT